MIRYLPGIVLVQVATVALVVAALKTDDRQLWVAIACLAAIINLVTAFWFGSITNHLKKDAIAKVQQQFSREREELRVNAEQKNLKLLQQTSAQMAKATNRAHAKANFKVGAAFTGIIGAGALMIFTQFMTLGVLTIATGGGALAGYLLRFRQDQAILKNQPRDDRNGRSLPRVEYAPGRAKKLPGPGLDDELKPL
jgi:hypothetical protein